MSKNLAAVAALIALVGASCGPPNVVVRPVEPEGPAWFPQVVDIEGDAGGGVSLATDADGNPHMAYLAFEEEADGETPPAPAPGTPELPAVIHAHLVAGQWTRGPVAEGLDVDPDDRTAIAVDADGVHHVVWTERGGLKYSSTAEGEFSEAEAIPARGAAGPSIAVSADGAVAVAFYEILGGAEGPGALVRVATPAKKGWEVETAAEASAPEVASTGIGFAGDRIMVAYGSEGRTLLARSTEGPWRSETADEDGGVGVSMALGAGGTPHLAYANGAGDVKHAHPRSGGRWEVSDVGTGAEGSAVAIAVDEEGVHHVAWQTAEGLAYAGNAEGDFAEEELPPETATGEQPRLGAGAEGVVYLAWFDAEDAELQMATRSESEPLLAFPSPSPTAGGGATTPAAECQPDGTELQVTAPSGAVSSGFDTDCLAAPAGEAFTVDFTNQDTVVHNVNIYTDQTAAESLFQGPAEGPVQGGQSTTYDVDPIDDPGDYFFQCDFHPTTMNGTFVVA